MAMEWVVALDVGGSSVKSGRVARDQAVAGLRTDPIDAHGTAEAIIGTLAAIIRGHQAALAGAPALGMAFGFPGPCDYPAGVSYIHGLAKYEAIYQLNIRAALQAALGDPALPIVFRNDAEAAVVGEACYGAGVGARRVVGITLGTGLGSCQVIDGEPQECGPGIPAEGWFGAVPYRGVQADDWFSTRGLLRRLAPITGEPVYIAGAVSQARQGDARLRAAFAQFGADLGALLQPYVAAFGGEVVLSLGGISEALDLFGPALEARVGVPVRPGALGSKAPLLGAARLLFAG